MLQVVLIIYTSIAPMKAASATSDAIQANSSVVGTAINGESFRVTSSNFGPTGDVQPSVVPTAKLDRFAVHVVPSKSHNK